ncbi:hypothetical protein Tco_1386221 [Tanacetum coccineum]
MSTVRNTRGKNQVLQGPEEPTPDAVLGELCDKNYHQILPLIAEKMQQEKEQQDRLEAVRSHLVYGNGSKRIPRNREQSYCSESKTPNTKVEPRKRHGHHINMKRHPRSPSPDTSVFKRLKIFRSPSLRRKPQKEGTVFRRLGGKEQSMSVHSDSRRQSSRSKGVGESPRRHYYKETSSRGTNDYSYNDESRGGHWKSKSTRHRSSTYDDDLS